MTLSIKLFAIIFIALLLVDYLWIGVIAKNFYMLQLKNFGRYENGQLKPILWAALIVYLALAFGVVKFAIPMASDTNLLLAASNGALFGFVVYAVYDFTNYATLAKWPLAYCLVDVTWGTILGGIVTVVGFWAKTKLI